MFKFLLLLFLIQITFCGLFGRSKNIKTLKNLDQIQKQLNQNQIVSVFFYLGKNCENCGNAWNLIEKLADENEGVLKVYDIDCDELWNDQYSHAKYYLCDPSTRKQLPQVTFYQPPTRKYNPYTKQPMEPTEHRFSGEANPKALAQFGHKLLPAFRIKINNTDDYDDFLQKEPKLNKVILFTEKKVTAAIYKGLSIHYYKRLYFGEVTETPDNNEILDEFEIEEFPQDGSYTRELYEGDVIWDRLVRYLDKHAAPEQVELEHPEIFEPPEEVPSDKKRRKRDQQQQEQQQKQEKEKEKEKPKSEVTLLTKDVYEKILLKNEKPALVQVFKDKVHPQWEEIQKKYRTLFDYYSFKVTNENDEQFVKSELAVPGKLPAIRFFAVGNTQRKKAAKVIFNEQMKFDEIQKDIQDLIDDKSINVNDKELQFQLQGGLQEGKALIILFYNTQSVSLTFRILSALTEYSDKFKFLTFKNAPENVLAQFQVRSQPQIVSVFRDVPKSQLEEPLKNEEIRIAGYQGKIIYHELVEFLRMFDEDQKKSSTLKKIVEIKSQTDLEELCVKKSSSCFIGLLNGQHKNQTQLEDQTKWEYQINIMERIKDKFSQRPGTFVFIDASCHDELLSLFEISDDFLPNYIQYSSSKKQYAKLIGMFDFESISRFVDNFFKGRTSLFNLQQELQLQEKNCLEVYEQRAKSSQSSSPADEEDDILKEILEEERKKREQIEKELKAEKKKGKKKKNKQDKEEL